MQPERPLQDAQRPNNHQRVTPNAEDTFDRGNCQHARRSHKKKKNKNPLQRLEKMIKKRFPDVQKLQDWLKKIIGDIGGQKTQPPALPAPSTPAPSAPVATPPPSNAIPV
jgi:hypothetical protein